MGVVELLLLSIGLAMDAFAVSICKGISMKKMNWKKAIIIGLYFGGFQALMPTLGFFLGAAFQSLITSIDHWIAFALLAIIGGGMIKESFDDDSENKNDDECYEFVSTSNSKVVKVEENEYTDEYETTNLKANVVLENGKSLEYNDVYNFIDLSK